MARPRKPPPKPRGQLKFNDKANSQYLGMMMMGSKPALKPVPAALKFNDKANSQYIGTVR